jgi:hypothetical protein
VWNASDRRGSSDRRIVVSVRRVRCRFVLRQDGG